MIPGRAPRRLPLSFDPRDRLPRLCFASGRDVSVRAVSGMGTLPCSLCLSGWRERAGRDGDRFGRVGLVRSL